MDPGGELTFDIEKINNPHRSGPDLHRPCGGKSTVNVERINNLHGSAPDPHGSVGIDSPRREDQQSTWISPGSVQILGGGAGESTMTSLCSQTFRARHGLATSFIYYSYMCNIQITEECKL